MTSFSKVAEVGDIQSGSFLHVEFDGVSAVLFNIDEEYYAIDAVCTHRGGNLFEGNLDGDCIVCPLHGARFDIRTGVKERGKPDQNVDTYQVRVDGNAILLGTDSA